jgi:hypothetical protein
LEAVRTSTAGAPATAFSTAVAYVPAFRKVSIEDVINAIRRLPETCYAINPLPTYLLKTVSCYFAAFSAEHFKRSLQSDRVPLLFKAAYIVPLIKKPDLDVSNVRSYRPISNQSVVPKLQERLAARQLIAHLKQLTNCSRHTD